MAPAYEYFCNDGPHHKGCGHEFLHVLSVEERGIPMDEPCPKCGKEDQICRKISNFTTMDSIRMNPAGKMDPGVRANIEAIKAEHPDMKTRLLD